MEKIHDIELSEEFIKYNKEFIEELKKSDLYIEVINFNFENIETMSYFYYEQDLELEECYEIIKKDIENYNNYLIESKSETLSQKEKEELLREYELGCE